MRHDHKLELAVAAKFDTHRPADPNSRNAHGHVEVGQRKAGQHKAAVAHDVVRFVGHFVAHRTASARSLGIRRFDVDRSRLTVRSTHYAAQRRGTLQLHPLQLTRVEEPLDLVRQVTFGANIDLGIAAKIFDRELPERVGHSLLRVFGSDRRSLQWVANVIHDQAAQGHAGSQHDLGYHVFADIDFDFMIGLQLIARRLTTQLTLALGNALEAKLAAFVAGRRQLHRRPKAHLPKTHSLIARNHPRQLRASNRASGLVANDSGNRARSDHRDIANVVSRLDPLRMPMMRHTFAIGRQPETAPNIANVEHAMGIGHGTVQFFGLADTALARDHRHPSERFATL